MELLDCVAAKFHEEPGVFKLLVKSIFESMFTVNLQTHALIHIHVSTGEI